MSSRDLFTASRDLFVNIKDLLVIFDPTNGISINNHLLLPINSPHGEEVGGSWLLAYLLSCLFDLLVLSFYLISRLFGGKTPTSRKPTGMNFSLVSTIMDLVKKKLVPRQQMN